jgi:hypothetical protein
VLNVVLRRYKLMPAELFDTFMSVLPPKLGWTIEERSNPEMKRKAFKESLHLRERFDQDKKEMVKTDHLHLPTRAMKVLVPYRYGHGKHTRSGYANMEWEEARQMQRERAEHAVPIGCAAATAPCYDARLYIRQFMA